MAAIILVRMSLILHFGSGPLWGKSVFLTSHCKENWWATVLHIQNYVIPFMEMVRTGFEWR
jgi:hypothetical protein